MIKKLMSVHENLDITEKQMFINAIVAAAPQAEVLSLVETSIDLPYKIRRPIIKRAAEDMIGNFRLEHRKVLDGLIRNLDQAKGNTRVKIAYCVKELLLALSSHEAACYVNILLSSQYVSVRRRGYAYLKSNWTEACKNPLIKSFQVNNDIEAARLLINFLSISDLKVLFGILDSVTQDDFIRRKLYVRLLEFSPSIIERLKKDDPITYTYLRCKAKLPLKHEEALDLFYGVHPDEKCGIMIWAFGKMGLMKTLDLLISEWPKLAMEIRNKELRRLGIEDYRKKVKGGQVDG